MKVVTNLEISMNLADQAIDIEIYNDDAREYLGLLQLTGTGVVWWNALRDPRTEREIEVTWPQFIKLISQDDGER